MGNLLCRPPAAPDIGSQGGGLWLSVLALWGRAAPVSGGFRGQQGVAYRVARYVPGET